MKQSLTDGGAGFGCGKACAVSNPKHIWISVMLKAVFVEIQPANLVGQRTSFNHQTGPHRWCNMEHLILRNGKKYIMIISHQKNHGVFQSIELTSQQHIESESHRCRKTFTSITLVSPGLSRFSNTASCLSGRTSIKFWRRFTCRSRAFTMSHRVSAYFLIPNSTGSDVLYITLAFALLPLYGKNVDTLEKVGTPHNFLYYITIWFRRINTFLR